MATSGQADGAFFQSVEAFVDFSGGNHAIKKILIANNGIGAIKAIRSIRRWAYETFGNERAVQFVVMATPEDMKANAEYIRLADEVVDVPGGTNNNNYANITLICEIAERLVVDAVMPMWGHASENPSLPLSLLKLKHRVTFIGPPAEPMHALGDKIGSTIIAQSAGVPVIGWNGDDLRVDYKKTGIPAEVYAQANVLTPEAALACADRIGYPVMIKASEGGGGKGIRKVMRSEDVLALFRQVQAEIPGSPIFVMKMASKARHLEVQLIADQYGEAIALSGRDCSVQRRHQKIIEEGPPIAAPTAVFKRMEQAAVALAKTVGYCNAGTVEYLFLEDHSFAFLELNPRLQVEHPVTENILGLNLPTCQLQVAMGIPLHRIADIRRLYGRHPRGTDTIDFQYAERVAPPRHCLAVRVTAENPEASFQPTSGAIRELHFHSQIDVWGYFSVESSGSIHEFADSQFGHIFASGPDRESARRAMIVALKELQIRGDIRTTTEYIIKMLQSADFVNNNINTDWLDGRIARHKELSIEEAERFCPAPTVVAACGAALQGYQHFVERDRSFVAMLRVGQVPSKDTLSPHVSVDLIFNNTKYITTCVQAGPLDIIVRCNGSSQSIQVRPMADGGFLLNLGGKSHLAYYSRESGGAVRMTLDGHTCMFTPEYDPTVLSSSISGKLARQLVADGAHLEKGEAYVEVEVMKMYMPLKTAEAGTVHFQMSEGATLSAGDVIATVTLDNPDKVVKSEAFKGSLALAPTAEAAAQTSLLQLRAALTSLERVLSGYPLGDNEIEAAVTAYTAGLAHRLTPVLEIEEAMSVLRGRIDADCAAAVLGINSAYAADVAAGRGEDAYPAAAVLSALQAQANTLPAATKGAFLAQTATVWSCAEQQLYPADVRIVCALLKLVETFVNVERLFDNMSFTDVVSELRKEQHSELEKVLDMCRSHCNIKAKNVLMVRLVEEMKTFPLSGTAQRPNPPAGVAIRNELNTRSLKLRLADLAKMRDTRYSHVSFMANLALMEQYSLQPEVRRQRLDEAITLALTTGDRVGEGDRALQLKRFAESNIVIRDLLFDALRHDKEFRIAVLELYIRKVYQKTHDLKNMSAGHSLIEGSADGSPWIRFDFATKSVEAIGSSELDGAGRLSYTDLEKLSRPRTSSNSTADPESPISSSRSDTALDKSGHNIVFGNRVGVLGAVESLEELPAAFLNVLRKIPEAVGGGGDVNAIHIVLLKGLSASDDECAQTLTQFLSTYAVEMKSRSVRRVSFIMGPSPGEHRKGPGSSAGLLFTFRGRKDFGEDRLFRHIEAPHAFHLDLPRLANFTLSLETGVQTTSGNVHLYKAIPRSGKGPRRYFARLVSFTSDAKSSGSDAETLFVEALDALGLVIGQEEALPRGKPAADRGSAANHLFLNIVAPDAVIQPDYYEQELRRICTKYWYKMVRLAISTVELKLTCRLTIESEPLFLRFIASNPTGFVLKIDQYYEASINGEVQFKAVAGSIKGPLDGLPAATPYEVTERFEQQRALALASSDTLYAYDWPILFEAAAERLWDEYQSNKGEIKGVITSATAGAVASPSAGSSSSGSAFSCRELVMCDVATQQPFPKGWTAKQAEERGVLLPMATEPGLNDAGMIAWLVSYRSPEYPQGREVVIVCNDITKEAGSFGTKEDIVFFKASEFARRLLVPRIYLAANSGARIGMAQSLKSKFQVCFNDEKDPSRGFKYIYLSEQDHSAFAAKYPDPSDMPVICTPTPLPDGTTRFVISDIIGEEADLGVENLMGSGLIAGETARAYDEIFTLTLVVGRTVGIGAYLVRLGQRTIQRTRNSPIILTGYQALNKLMGREIYTTNDQLGGPMIMFPNGVSHALADTHMESVVKALNWLSFVPAIKGGHLPMREIAGVDTVERTVDFAPRKGLTYDPRFLCTGHGADGPDGTNWVSGFFDKHSFCEALAGWAKTVVVGRGRLGGIPMGVIITENRTAEALKPADPADATSQERMVQQAGGVWFPDSAYKTAQALRDFNREGLPCIIFANWRGFSGGQRDMFDEVLKFGSMIVDALVAYGQPLFVYIPPFAELRGGAWVVVDSTINADVMEFYAAEDARGGVLEATGAASIKFRDRDIVAAAHRIDSVLVALDASIAATKDPAELTKLQAQVAQREKLLFGVYQQVAVHFADLHDTPGRMKAKGVIRRQVAWAQSRAFFFWRLRRRLTEFDLAAQLASAGGSSSGAGSRNRREAVADMKAWFLSTGGKAEMWDDDRKMMLWLTDNSKTFAGYVDRRKAEVRAAALAERVSSSEEDVLKLLVAGLSPAAKARLTAALQN